MFVSSAVHPPVFENIAKSLQVKISAIILIVFSWSYILVILVLRPLIYLLPLPEDPDDEDEEPLLPPDLDGAD